MLLFGLILLLLLLGRTATSDGQPCVVGSLRPIVVAAGDNVVLPCHLEPPQNVEDEVVEWSRQEHGPVQYVHVHRDHGEVTDMKAASYHSRTALFPEELKHGNISLKITGVTPADEGSYRCFVPTLSSPAKSSTVRLTVKPDFPRVAPTVDPESPSTDDEAARGRAHLPGTVAVVLIVVILVAGAVFWKFCRQKKGSKPEPLQADGTP